MNKLRIFFAQIVQEPKIYSPFLAGLFLNFLIWALIIWRLPMSVNWIPLHYNSYFGIDWIGPWTAVTHYPAVALGIIIINLLLPVWLTKADRRFINLLNWTAVLVQVIIFIALIFLIINYFS